MNRGVKIVSGGTDNHLMLIDLTAQNLTGKEVEGWMDEAHLTANDASLKGDVVILAPNDGTARSIADTFAADADVKSYVITGQDAEVASVNYIANGKQSMTVFKNTSTLAADSCAMAAAILNNTTHETVTTYNNGKKDVPAKQTDITVVTQDNYKEVLIDSGYYTEDEIK
jgi:putative multiple sugar transport system substrate-binding protein